MIICPEAFLDAPEVGTLRTTLPGVEFDPEVSLTYTADERGLLVHDWFDGTLCLVDLTRRDLSSNVIGRVILGVTPCRASDEPVAYLLTEDLHLVRKVSWDTPVKKEEVVCKLIPEDVELPLLLDSFGELLAVCSSKSVTIVNTNQKVIAARIDLGSSSSWIRWVNIRMIQGRLCAEWATESRSDGLRTQSYRVHDCLAGVEVYFEQFHGDDRWLLPMDTFDRTGIICNPERSEVLLFRDSLTYPIERVRVVRFDGQLDVSRSENRDILAVFGGGGLHIYEDGALDRTLSVSGSYGRFKPLNESMRAMAFYEWSRQSQQDGVQLTGVFDYLKGTVIGRAHGHINGVKRKVSPSSRYLATVYSRTASQAVDDPRYPPGTVVVSDLDSFV